ncbi:MULTISPECIES: FadR/GntR family transcriptional regulator [unclassified Novosphingobium]|uniref:FadR/GntR family transcriptional regulator n=1 Tax=unclassified Novosphingobium TaxID=2644732 RepID=UPI001469CEB1|nr:MULTISPECIES: FadR/GntR family transcriptional regulator [unclassified Novosphingobium]NMN87203.1 DNA-binding FadR family transcriptional regulator [Novosphingobium sp. SG916]
MSILDNLLADSLRPRRNNHLASRGGVQPLRNSHDHVVAALGSAIVSGTFAQGAHLPGEDALLARFTVSRTVLREALKTLAAKGLIVSRTRVGTRVLPRQHWNLFDTDVLSWHVVEGVESSLRAELTDFRFAIEPAAAALAARHATAGQIAQMRELVAAMAAAQDSRLAFAQADLALHQLIGQASGNRLMAGTGAVIETALFASFTLSSPVDDRADHAASVRGHAAIVEAIAARDGVAAAEAVRGVIRHGQERIDAVEQRQGEIKKHER